MQKPAHLDTDDFATGPFAPHGNLQIAPEGRIIRLASRGPFNMEAMQALGRARAAMLEQRTSTAPYAYLNVFSVSIMMSAECLSTYLQGVRDAYTARFQAPAALAWVVPPGVEGGRIMINYLKPGFEEIGIPFEIFAAEAQALEWVEQALRTQEEAIAHSLPKAD